MRLLWWIFITPGLLPKNKTERKRAMKPLGSVLSSLAIWLPLIIPTLALGVGSLPRTPDAWSTQTYLLLV